MSNDPVERPATIEPLLTPEQAAKILSVSTSYLAKSRVDGDGPEFVKIGRAVRYPESSLRKFIKARTRTSTSAESASISIHRNT
jgi:predicted DNA-binding transcriptional regulator AlpA